MLRLEESEMLAALLTAQRVPVSRRATGTPRELALAWRQEYQRWLREFIELEKGALNDEK